MSDPAETLGLKKLTGVPEGMTALVIAETLRGHSDAERPRQLVHVARDDRRLDAVIGQLKFFAPDLRVIALPAWDTVPYDRASPKSDIIADRITALAKLALPNRSQPTVVVTTVNAVLQRVPPRARIRSHLKQIAPGQRIDLNRFIQRLSFAGYQRTGTVMEPGEFAVRGGIIDVFVPARRQPVRLDFFGDTLESIKAFDAETQRTIKAIRKLALLPISEIAFGDDAIATFRKNYVALFGGNTGNDPLYEAVSAGQRYQGQEHWLPLYHDQLETVFDYAGDDALFTFDAMAPEAVPERVEQIEEHYQARLEALEAAAFGAPPYKPVPPEQMFLDDTALRDRLQGCTAIALTAFDDGRQSSDDRFRAKAGRSFAAERQARTINVFEAASAHIKNLQNQNKRVLLAAWTTGARARLTGLLHENGIPKIQDVGDYGEVLALPEASVAFGVVGLEQGFETADLAVVAEQDILGDRLVRPQRKKRKAAEVLTEATSLAVGDLVVHADHGIGRFQGLKTITALDAPHDCLEITYAGGDRLYLPVENIELLSRYGSDEGKAQLDKLGGANWQARKAKLKKRLHEIAGELIKTAAARQLREAPVLVPDTAQYEEFVAGFPFEETEDQAQSIEAVLSDLASGRPMDRLVCGDVGFGKTEVALRAAFVAAMSGVQVAVIVPTTLLARQHFKTFKDRFEGFPVNVQQASRLVDTKTLSAVKDGLKSGSVDVVVGTHALLGKQIEFARLGLLVIDEEQHFGVTHKERLKKMRDDVHVLTLSATPIPRTLQLSLTGVRELSLITTPPVDRLAVRTYISQVDPVILRDALKRERFRGGQSFYVVPRISDLETVTEFLRESVPELKVATAHGQLTPGALEDVMTAFYDGQYDILVSTAIVESGLDVPNANTLIVHRADMFGLAQLYQLRGRVGRSKTRAYAYFTTPPGEKLTPAAEKRLKVLQSLDALGAGFSLAAHDLDIRGAGNLLGEEQSGHIREVGFELYQSMLEEAVAAMKGGADGEASDTWSPEISLGTAALIPEAYAGDLQVRLGLYRRLAKLDSREDIDAFAAELVDRFGPLPDEVQQLLDIIEIKALALKANIAKVESGPKGAVIAFRNQEFADPEGLVALIQSSHGRLKLLDDQKVLVKGSWDDMAARVTGTRNFIKNLVELANDARKAA